MKMYDVKIGPVELTNETIEKYLREGRNYICAYSGIWRICYSEKRGRYYGSKLFNTKRYARRGRYYAQRASEVNEMLNHQYGYENMDIDKVQKAIAW